MTLDLVSRNIEDDVRQNAHDIVDLRIDVSHNQEILAQGLKIDR